MASGGIDRRIERTRETVHKAFIELLFERGYADISIAEIAERANVGRSTLYEHFEGKEDLLRQSLARPLGPLVGIVGGEAGLAEVTAFVSHLRENYKLARAMFAGPTRPAIVRALAELLEEPLGRVARTTPGCEPIVPLRLVALQLAEAQIGLVDHWLTSGLPCRAEDVAEALVATTQAMVTALLRG